jgi:hypothetical protein
MEAMEKRDKESGLSALSANSEDGSDFQTRRLPPPPLLQMGRCQAHYIRLTSPRVLRLWHRDLVRPRHSPLTVLGREGWLLTMITSSASEHGSASFAGTRIVDY